MGAPANPFIGIHAPMLWATMLTEFGTEVDYWPDHDAAGAVTIDVVWKEGAADEETSPGRYSNIWVRNSDIPQGPRLGDGVSANGVTYNAVRIDATAYGFSRVVLQEDDGG